jgi:hypothetical protein
MNIHSINKKKILITGMNREQNKEDYFQTKELKILNSHYSLIRCLKDIGFEVEQRPVTIGEDLSSYYEVIVYLHSIQSFCQHLYDGLYAIAARPNCILSFDDWQINQIIGSIITYKDNLINEKTTNPFRKYLLDLYQGNSDEATILKYKADYLKACDIILSRQNRMLICSFAGGDLTKLKSGWSSDRMFQYNPNPYNLNRRPETNYGEPIDITSFCDDNNINPESKIKSWIFSSLVQNKTRKWLDNQNTNWPITIFGGRRGQFKSERVTEPEMCRIYNKHWGCLMPTYYHAGSGWWRSRVQQVVDAHSILYCEDNEGIIYGEAFTKMKISDIEQMDIDQLQKLANYQRECLYDNHPLDKSIQKNELKKVLESI